jgi:Asp-tRNA(Asn)/Glu-tRNA(Gln) amidotransferase A subunit family amidase
VRAHCGQELLRREVDAALSAVDALILPTLPIVAPPLGASTVPMDPGDEPVRAAMLRLTQPFNLTGHPAMTIPIDPSPDGLPIGLQIVGQRTPRLLDVAAVIERVLSDE